MKRQASSSTRLAPAQWERRRARVVEVVKALPGTAVSVHGERHLRFAVDGKPLGWLLDDHHGDGRLSLECKAHPGANRQLAAADPSKYHVPKYVGHLGWVGLWLDLQSVDWPEVKSFLTDAYDLTVPKRKRIRSTAADNSIE